MKTEILTSASALFLDFDGTLVGIQDDPDAVHLPQGGAELLLELAAALDGAVALVSGRDVRDLSARAPTELWRAGNHGDIILPPGQSEPASIQTPPGGLVDAMQALADQHKGARLEQKARVLTIHTRACPENEDAVAAAASELAAQYGGYKVQRGKDVTELKPEGVNKGEAIAHLLQLAPFQGRTPLFIGDDTTDEDGFLTSIHRGGSAIKVGPGKTLAPHRVADPEAVWTFLKGALHDLT